MTCSQQNDDNEFIIDDSEVIAPEEVLEQVADKTEAALEALPYQVVDNSNFTLEQQENRTFRLAKTMKEKFNCPEAKWKQFLHPSIREKFLEYVRQTGSLTGAVVRLRKFEQFDIASGTVKTLLSRFPVFHAMYTEAQEEYRFKLEEEATRRAVEGVAEGVWYQGECVGTEQKFSDSLLAKLLEANVGKFQKKATGGNTTFNGPIQVNIKKDFG